MNYCGSVAEDQQQSQIKALCYLLTGILPKDQSITIRQSLGVNLTDARKWKLENEDLSDYAETVQQVTSREAILLESLDVPVGIRERVLGILNSSGFQAKRVKTRRYDSSIDVALGR